MFAELPKDSKTVGGTVSYSTTDTGDRFVSFASKDIETARGGFVVGFVIPAGVSERQLQQVLGEIRSLGGVRFIVRPRKPEQAKPERIAIPRRPKAR
jgi:hypothetical protein